MIFFELMHELGECLIDDGLILIVIREDDGGELSIVMEKISERKHEMMFVGVEGASGSMFILELLVAVSELLDEGGELFLDLVAETLFGEFGNAFNLHGA